MHRELINGTEYSADILSTDVVKHSRFLSSESIASVDTVLTAFRKLVQRETELRGGKLLPWAGNGGIALFVGIDTSDCSIFTAISIIKQLDLFNIESNPFPHMPLRVRLFLHRGKILYHENYSDIRSEDLNWVVKSERNIGKINCIRITASVFNNMSPKVRQLFFKIDERVEFKSENRLIVLDLFEYDDLQGIRISWDDVTNYVQKIIEDINRDNKIPDIVIGVGRGGAIMGGLIAGNLGSLPLFTIDRDVIISPDLGRTVSIHPFDYTHLKGKKVLVITGEVVTAMQLKETLCIVNDANPEWVISASLYVNDTAIMKPTYYGFSTRNIVKVPWRISPEYIQDSFPIL